MGALSPPARRRSSSSKPVPIRWKPRFWRSPARRSGTRAPRPRTRCVRSPACGGDERMTVVFILWLREVKKYLRSRVQIVASLGAPLMYLGVLGFGLGPVFRRAGEGSYLQFMAPGVIGMTVLFTAMFSGIAMLWDRQFGFLKETLVAPVPRLAIMIGRTLDHDRQTRHRRDEGLFQESELAVPQHGDPREHGRKQHGHADHAGRHELEVAPLAGAPEHGAEPEAEHAQVHERGAERGHDLDARAQVFLHFPQPQNEDDGHALISSTRGRPDASGPRPWRSRPGSSCR